MFKIGILLRVCKVSAALFNRIIEQSTLTYTCNACVYETIYNSIICTLYSTMSTCTVYRVLYTIHGGKFARDAMETWMVGHCHVETCR